MTPLLLISLIIGLALFASVFAAWREIKHFRRSQPTVKLKNGRALIIWQAQSRATVFFSSPVRKPKTSRRQPAARYMITGTRSGFLKLQPKGQA